MNRRVAFYTLGCKLNFSETSTIARQFEQKGYQKVDFADTPDIFIINTCSVTENADKKCRKIVRQARQVSPHAFVAIIGCYAQLKPNEIAEIEGVDAVLGASEKFKLLQLLDDFERTERPQVMACDITEATTFNNAFSYGDRTRTFLKVQDGCNYNCSFCTIPLARGKSRSNEMSNVLQTAQEIAQTEVKEVVLTGVNTGDYGIIDGRRKYHFIDLIRALDQIQGIARFRISSIEPNLLTDEIIQFVATAKRFVPHFHIPLQSGNNDILRKMSRRYNQELYANRVDYIKKLMPNACIGADVIVGFPSETKQHFLETYNFLNELPISYLHVFTYSERANTRALQINEVIEPKIRNERSKMLRILSEKKKRFFYEQNIGRTEKVLFEKDIKGKKMEGFTNNYVRVITDLNTKLINQVCDAQMISLDEKGLMNATCTPNLVCV